MQVPFARSPDCPLGLEDCPALQIIRRLQKECKRLLEISQTDPLTGLFNRRYLLNALDREMERTRRTGLATSLIMIDLDNFKKVNDIYGHRSGDAVLQEVGQIWRRNIRKLDIPCRYGGEEFVIILPGTRQPHAVRLAERLKSALGDQAVELDEVAVSVTASFGVDTYVAQENLSAEAFLDRVDQLLLQAKALGRNLVHHQEGDKARQTTEVTPEERLAIFPKKQGYEKRSASKRKTAAVLPDQR